MVRQLEVIGKMVTDLSRGIRIEGVASLREPDGLPMSTRNRFLSAAQRGSIRRINNIAATRCGFAFNDEHGGVIRIAAAVQRTAKMSAERFLTRN